MKLRCMRKQLLSMRFLIIPGIIRGIKKIIKPIDKELNDYNKRKLGCKSFPYIQLLSRNKFYFPFRISFSQNTIYVN